MNSLVFSTNYEAYNVEKVVYVGPILEIPEDRRKNGYTHYFKIITSVGPEYCQYDSQENARKARGALAMKIDQCKKTLFKHGLEVIDPKKVVAFSSVFALKTPQGEKTHAFTVIVETSDDKSAKVWLTYKSQDFAEKGRKALYAVVHAAYDSVRPNSEKSPQEQPVAVAAETATLPF